MGSASGFATARAARDHACALTAIWLICTLINLGKAAHIDDTAHLEIARWILANPLHPMIGRVQWGDHAEPIHHLNQPHLFFYLLALGNLLGGGALWVLQLIEAAFVALGISCFAKLWHCVVGTRDGALVATACLFLGPGFIPGQNIMLDAPILALSIAFALSLVRATGARRTLWLALAGTIAGLACLTKYTSLPLLLVLAAETLIATRGLRARERWRMAAPLLIPIGMLLAWSLFNVFDYGAVHLLGRIDAERTSGLKGLAMILARGGVWLITLGAISPFVVSLVPTLRAQGVLTRARLLGLALGAVTCGLASQWALSLPSLQQLWAYQARPESLLHSIARALFFFIGAGIVWLSVRCLRSAAPRGDEQPQQADDERRISCVLGSWAVGSAAFVVLLSPFIAVRHVLLVLPPLILLIGRRHRESLASEPSRAWVRAAFGLSALLGMWLGISDRRLAAVYRDQAAQYCGPAPGAADRPRWFVGHWGLQWYASACGLRPYEPGVSQLADGDRLLKAQIVAQQRIAPSDWRRLRSVAGTRVNASPLELLRTMTELRGYYSLWQGLPYTFSREPLDTFEIFEFSK